MTLLSLMQRIILKYRKTIDVFVLNMDYGLNDNTVKKIITFLFIYSLIITVAYILSAVSFIINPSQGTANLTWLFIIYIVISLIFVIIMVVYTSHKRPKLVKINGDKENLDKLKVLFNEEIDERTMQEKSESNVNQRG